LSNRRRDVKPERAGEIVHELARCARADVGQCDRARWFVRRDVVINDELRYLESSHRFGERAQTLDVADVEHDQQIDIAQRSRALPCVVPDIVAEQEVEEIGPRRGIHDAYIHPALRQHASECRF